MQENVQLAEAAPSTPGNIMVPPLYSASKTERRVNVEDDDFFADMLGEARRESDDTGMFQQAFGEENEGSEEGKTADKMAYDRLDSVDDNFYNQGNLHLMQTEMVTSTA